MVLSCSSGGAAGSFVAHLCCFGKFVCNRRSPFSEKARECQFSGGSFIFMTIGHEESAASDAMVGKGVDRGEPGPFQIEKAPPDTMSLGAIWWWGSERVCAIRRDSGASSRRRSSSWGDVSPKSPSSSVRRSQL